MTFNKIDNKRNLVDGIENLSTIRTYNIVFKTDKNAS